MTTRKASTGFLSGIVALAAAALMTQAGCSTQAAGVTCQAGSTVTCSCQGALTGQAQCDSTGHESACNCTGGGSGSGGSSSSGGLSGGSSGGSSGSSSGGVAAEGGTSADAGGEGGEIGDGATGG